MTLAHFDSCLGCGRVEIEDQSGIANLLISLLFDVVIVLIVRIELDVLTQL
jgi:hypothetical protein